MKPFIALTRRPDIVVFAILVLTGTFILTYRSISVAGAFLAVMVLGPVISRIHLWPPNSSPIRMQTDPIPSSPVNFVPEPDRSDTETSIFDRPLLSVVVPFTNVDELSEIYGLLTPLASQQVEIVWVWNTPRPDMAAWGKLAGPIPEQSCLVIEKRRGAGIARNSGLKVARGDFLWFVDSDDAVVVENFPNLLGYLTMLPEFIDLVLFEATDVDPVTGETRRPDWFLRKTLADGYHFTSSYRANLLQQTNPAAWNKVFRSSFIRENRLRFSCSKAMNDVAFVAGALVSSDAFAVSRLHVYHYNRGRVGSLQTSGYTSFQHVAASWRVMATAFRQRRFFGFRKTVWKLVASTGRPILRKYRPTSSATANGYALRSARKAGESLE